MKRVWVARIALLLLAASATAVALDSKSSALAEAAACRCPLVYAPVQCDKGKVYPNQCVADCHHATNCVPIGP